MSDFTIPDLKRALVEVSKMCERFWNARECTTKCPFFHLSEFECPMQQSRIPRYWEVDHWKEDDDD